MKFGEIIFKDTENGYIVYGNDNADEFGVYHDVSIVKLGDTGEVEFAHLQFQKGNPREKVNGCFIEHILKLSSIMLENWGKSELATRETSIARTKIDEAILWLGKRAADRKERGVWGTHEK